MPMFTVQGPRVIPSGLDPATTAWVAAVVAAGGAVSPTQQGRVNTLIAALKSHGLFTQLDRLWLFGGESVHQQAKIDIINLGVGTEQGNLTSTGLSASGYVSNGTTGYFDSNFAPSSGPNSTTAAAAIGLYITIGASPGGQQSGVQDSGTGVTDILNPYHFGNAVAQVNNGFLSSAVAGSDGMYVGTQVSGVATLYNFSTSNGHSGSINSGANAAPLIPVSNFFFVAFNSVGTPANFQTDTVGAGFLGGGLSSADVSNLAADINAYMAAWGLARF